MTVQAAFCFLCVLVLLLSLPAESCTRRQPATMPPPATTAFAMSTPAASVRLPCNSDEQHVTSCINGNCVAVNVWTGSINLRTPFCDCNSEWEGARCDLPSLPASSAAGPANIAAGVLISALLLVSLLIGLTVYFKYKKRSQEDESTASSSEVEAAAPFCTAPTTYSRRDLKKVPGPSSYPPLQSVSSREDRIRLLPAIDVTIDSVKPNTPPLARQETLSEVQEKSCNNGTASVHVHSASIPTPLVEELAPFDFNSTSSHRPATGTRL